MTDTDRLTRLGRLFQWAVGSLAAISLMAIPACAQEADDPAIDEAPAETTNYDVDGDGQLDLEAMLEQSEARRAEAAEEVAHERGEAGNKS
ncbi:hypothetical protein [Maricaulis salignorans]|uniref:hypothetical protein n=1 Tax=Maricaulis salignorans TaxID=144026 RepID=UPI003A925073